jgi:diadenosine tetraphosphate (Ap4A) HIT family hydrolase
VNAFILDARLAADTIFVADWSLSRVLLMNDARYPWLILVPRRPNAMEVFDLSSQDRATLTEEVARASAMLKKLSACAKINVGALGNLVPQLHVHVVARSPGDAAWPGPVWGNGTSIPYSDDAARSLVERLRSGL